MPKTIRLECVRVVEEFFFEDIDNAFLDAAEWVPSERFMRSDLKEWLREAKINPDRSREFKVQFKEFVEFDSGNIGHAGAYYAYDATGPDRLVDKLREGLK